MGAKWDFARRASVTAAAYNLSRGNVAVVDPLDPAATILVDAQRTRGVELGVHGSVTSRWTVLGAYAHQDGRITRALSATVGAGARLANLPEHSLSLWNRYEVSRRAGVGLGLIYRSDTFASTDNTVLLPSYVRADAAVFLRLASRLDAQVRVENLLNERYHLFAHSNNNITPGSPRALRVNLTTVLKLVC